MQVKALSLLQPWATLIAIGAKTIETRSWATKYRGPLAIHASKGLPKKGLPWHESFDKALAETGINGLMECPRGAVIATCKLVDCVKTEVIAGALQGTNELMFGDYEPGRYAWILEDIKPLPEPIPAKGMLGLWEWDGNV